MKNNGLQELKESLTHKRLILLGEIHGAEVNTKIIARLVSELKIRIIMLELEKKWSSSLSTLKKKKYISLIDLFKKEQWIFESGLLGKKHLILFRRFLLNGKEIIPVKTENKIWNNAEKLTANNVDKILKNTAGTAILIMGNLHTRKKTFFMKEKGKKKKYIPLGSYLNSRAVSVCIRYGKGEAFNFRPIILKDKEAYNSGTALGILRKSRSKFYDFDYLVKSTKPISRISKG